MTYSQPDHTTFHLNIAYCTPKNVLSQHCTVGMTRLALRVLMRAHKQRSRNAQAEKVHYVTSSIIALMYDDVSEAKKHEM